MEKKNKFSTKKLPMISNSIIIIPSIMNKDEVCDFLFQTANILSKKNHVYIIHNGSFSIKEILQSLFSKSKQKIIERKSKITYLSPLEILPFQRFKVIKKINKSLYFKGLQTYLSIKHITAQKKIFWMFFPHLNSLVLKKNSSWKIIYDCVDYFQHLSETIHQQEINLIQSADLVFVNSKTLLKFHDRYKRGEIFLVPQGFRLQSFKKALTKKNKWSKSKPILGFIGGISNRLDFNLIYNLAKNNSRWTIVLWGPILSFSGQNKPKKEILKLKQLKNIIFGKSKQKNIPSIINSFDIGIIPYDVTIDFNKYCYPMKIFEYFYLGKPIISTPIKELELAKFKNLIKISNTAQGWENHINDLLSKPWPKKYQQKQRQLAVDNSWTNKIEAISQIIDGKI